jgi:phosphatidylserine synthase
LTEATNYLTVSNLAIAFGIPIALIFVTAITRKIARNTPPLWDDFYLGVELTLAAFLTAAVNVVDPNAPHTGQTAVWYIIVCFLLFMLQVFFFQDWSTRGDRSDKWKQILILGILSNLVGILLLGSFVLLKIGGKI